VALVGDPRLSRSGGPRAAGHRVPPPAAPPRSVASGSTPKTSREVDRRCPAGPHRRT
jgi:hypothetical protein